MVQSDLEKKYTNLDIKEFLVEASTLDARTKHKKVAPKEAWDRVEQKLIDMINEEKDK